MNAIICRNIELAEISVHEEFTRFRDEALEDSREITSVSDEFTQAMAVDTVKRLRDLESTVENSRKEVKAPVLEIGKIIDATARKALSGVEIERVRVGGLISAYAIEQKRKADEAERKRQEELQRLERERIAREEAERKHQEEVERLSKQAEAAKEAEETAFTDAEATKAKADAEAAETKKAEEEAAIAKQREESAAAEAERQKLQIAGIARREKPKGLAIKTTWKFEVTDIGALYRHSDKLVRIEPNSTEINALIRSGTREIPGLKIWSEDVAEVRR